MTLTRHTSKLSAVSNITIHHNKIIRLQFKSTTLSYCMASYISKWVHNVGRFSPCLVAIRIIKKN